nr:ribulose-phosphate 3-epimerase [Paratrimastix eleionoma]
MADVPLRKSIIAPSMLSSDFSMLAHEAADIIYSKGADWLHMDIMDGHFVPNLTIGACVVKSLRKRTPAFIDCHLMVEKPEDYVVPFKSAGANLFTFHFEATDHPIELVQKVKEAGMFCGIAIKPHTPVEALLEHDIPSLVDMVLVMTVEPGFGGQGFMEEMMPKVAFLRSRYPRLLIQVDGGLNVETAEKAAIAGANCIVAGSSIFGSHDKKQFIQDLRDAADLHTPCPEILPVALRESTIQTLHRVAQQQSRKAEEL